MFPEKMTYSHLAGVASTIRIRLDFTRGEFNPELHKEREDILPFLKVQVALS